MPVSTHFTDINKQASVELCQMLYVSNYLYNFEFLNDVYSATCFVCLVEGVITANKYIIYTTIKYRCTVVLTLNPSIMFTFIIKEWLVKSE